MTCDIILVLIILAMVILRTIDSFRQILANFGPSKNIGAIMLFLTFLEL